MDVNVNAYKKNPSILSKAVGEETILFQEKNGDRKPTYTLNKIGTFIWSHMDEKKEASEIKNLIIEEFDVSPEEAKKDLIFFLQQLEEIGVITQ
jgi:hypothetical protein